MSPHPPDVLEIVRQALRPRLIGRAGPGEPNEGAETWEQGGAEEVVAALHAHRDLVFGPGNDKVWGEDNWVRCNRPGCRDAVGFESYHHKDFHGEGDA